MALKMLFISSSQHCLGCAIPLPEKCARVRLSSQIDSEKLAQGLTFFDVITQLFKLRQPVVTSLRTSFADLELCRYCSLNLVKLIKYYRNILKVANETRSVFSKAVVQTKGRPGRPKKKVESPSPPIPVENQSPFVPVENPVDDLFSGAIPDTVPNESDSEEAPPGLSYLGLVRKKRNQAVTLLEDDNCEGDDGPSRGHDDLKVELLFPELSITEPVSKADDDSSSSEIISRLKGDKASPKPDPPATPITTRCKHCLKTFRHPQRLKHHLKTHHEDAPNRLECQETSKKRNLTCANVRLPSNKSRGKRGRSSKQLGKDLPLACASPSAETVKEKVKGTNTKKSKKDDCVCKICKRKFKHVQFLNQHMRVHSNDKRCAECEKKFKSVALLKRHMQIHNKDSSSFKCDDCEREFPNLLGLQVHAVTHTRTLYTCKGCKRKFKIEKNFIQHQETARCTEKKHPCPTCGKLFKNKDKVKRHLISMHSETKPFSCSSCGKGFRSQADLNFHEVNAHICGETKQFQCDQCGKRFKSLETLKSHEMYSHKMEKKHFCMTCGKGFPLLATLKIHEISHSTDRPYMCTYCGRTYKHANDLKSHEVVHYKDEEKPFVCPICGLRYHRKDVLRLHQAREKHFGPDLPAPTLTRKQPEPGKSKRNSNVFKLEDLIEEEPVESCPTDSSISNHTSTVVVTQPAPISVIQSINSQHLTAFTAQSQVGIVSQQTSSSSIAGTTHHLVPIVQPQTITLQQQHNNLTPPSFNVTVAPLNEAITDFYRIMYDLS